MTAFQFVVTEMNIYLHHIFEICYEHVYCFSFPVAWLRPCVTRSSYEELEQNPRFQPIECTYQSVEEIEYHVGHCNTNCISVSLMYFWEADMV